MATFLHEPLLGIPADARQARAAGRSGPSSRCQMRHQATRPREACLAALPGQLDRVDALLGRGRDRRRAARTPPTSRSRRRVRLMLNFDQLREHIDARPAGRARPRAGARLPGPVPGSVPRSMASVLRQDVTLAGRDRRLALRTPRARPAASCSATASPRVRDQRLPAYAERFAEAGLAALLFDYRHFGASGGEPRQLLDIGRQLEDWRTAIAYARGLDGIERVGLFGSSFGGGHAIELAATEPGVAAVVAQCPMTDGLLAALRMPPS